MPINDISKKFRILLGKKGQVSVDRDDEPEASGTGRSPMSGLFIENKLESEKKTDWSSITWIIIAFGIWVLVDRPPILPEFIEQFFGNALGQNYLGFNFLASNVIKTDWVAVVTSGIFVGLIIINVFLGLFKKDAGLMISIGVLFFSSYIAKARLGESLSFELGINYLVIVLFAAAIIGFHQLTRIKEYLVGELSYVFMALTYSYFYINNDWLASSNTFFEIPKPIIHFAFITVFGFIYIRNRFPENKMWCLITSLFLILDFFGHSMLQSNILVGIPILFFMTMGIVAARAKSGAVQVLVGIFMLLLLGLVLAVNTAHAGETTAFEAVDEAEGKTFIGTVRDAWAGFFGPGGFLQKRIEYAITGKVEKNQFEQLGVYLENVKSAEPKYYAGEEVVVWGSVKARTLDDPINIQLGCFVKEGGKKIPASKIDPKNAFSVFTLEEQDFACSFRGLEGSRTVTTFADFNFETLAFLKVYFMDRERLRAMTRENLDPLDEFSIQDKRPIAIYTNGPAEIGMETTTSLIGVSENYLAYPRLSFSIQNRQGWSGKIKALKELIILLPKGVDITDPENDCNRKFVRYDDKSCEKSCNDVVLAECNKVCENFPLGSSERDNCQQLCNDNKIECEKECKNLFEEGEQAYSGYTLDVDELRQTFKEDEDFGRFRFFSCRINPKPSEVLDNSPITTKSIRLKARYNYILEKTVSVRIEKDPSEDRTTKHGGVAIQPTTDLGKELIKISSQKGIDQSLAFALASKESSLTHCCQEPNNNRVGTCEKSEVSSCNLNRLVTSGSSYGVMQLNVKHCAWFYPEQVCMQNNIASLDCFSGYKDRFSGGWKEECDLFQEAGCASGQDATHVSCNIKLGLTFLKKLYENNKEKTKVWKCNGKTYSGWDLALRYYNGWGCSGADNEYVEDINKLRQEISQRDLQDFETKAPEASKSTQRLVDDNEVKPPTDLIIYSDENAVYLNWKLSEDDKSEGDVSIYAIYRDGKYLGFVEAGKTSFQDTEKLDPNEIYEYKVGVQDNSGNLASIEKEYNYYESGQGY